jgi:hypothetical protein
MVGPRVTKLAGRALLGGASLFLGQVVFIELVAPTLPAGAAG